jgi:hypothetical protein
MKRTIFVLGLALGVLIGSGSAEAAVVANSVTEFSCVQGQDNWRYGYYDGPFTSSDFQEMTQCIPDPQYGGHAWWVNPANYWTSVRSEVSFPNGPASCGRQPVEHWAVRRWISETTGTVTISGVVQNMFGGFDGFTALIIVDGTVVWSQHVPGTAPIPYSTDVAVSAGSLLDFAVDPGGSDCNDHAKFTATIVGGPICDIQLNQTSFMDGDAVVVQVFRFANPTTPAVAIEFKIWLEGPGFSPIPILRGGEDGSVVLPPGFNIDLGPFPLVPVVPALPRGPWGFSCRMLDPVTGALLSEDLNPFVIR